MCNLYIFDMMDTQVWSRLASVCYVGAWQHVWVLFCQAPHNQAKSCHAKYVPLPLHIAANMLLSFYSSSSGGNIILAVATLRSSRCGARATLHNPFYSISTI